MPYIDSVSRDLLEKPVLELANLIAEPGDLNYVICSLLSMLLNADDVVPGGPSYSDLSRWRAAVNDASDEFYRRAMVPYEESKRARNGDVFDEVLTALRENQVLWNLECDNAIKVGGTD